MQKCFCTTGQDRSYKRQGHLYFAASDLDHRAALVKDFAGLGLQSHDAVNFYIFGALGKIAIFDLFSQILDVLESVWIDVTNGNIDEVKQVINGLEQSHPVDNRYAKVENIDWECCTNVQSEEEMRKFLSMS